MAGGEQSAKAWGSEWGHFGMMTIGRRVLQGFQRLEDLRGGDEF